MLKRLDKNTKNKLEGILDKKLIFTDEDTLEKFSRDETENLSFYPDVVIKPENTRQIIEILKFANIFSIPVVPRGGGTGLSGGALPVFGGICISLEKFNRILEIDGNNFQAVVEPGVITQVFQEECEKIGLFYPPDPSSRGSCFLGGNLAECAGGPRAAKYGVTGNYVLGLEFVTPSGELINTGARVIKNVTGYNLTQLLIGSEGTLGIITKIILRLIKLPKYKKILLLSYDNIEKCISSVSEFYRMGVNPSALEFLEKAAVKAGEVHLNKKYPNGNAEAQLFIELDGDFEETIDSESNIIAEIAQNFGATDVIVAEERNKMEEIWSLRRCIGEAVKSISEYKEEDTVVPRFRLPDLIKGVKKIAANYRIKTICYGHAGDGNLHINILKDKMSDIEWAKNLDNAVKEIFELAVSLGGTISGEHGIGYTQKKFLKIALKEEEINLMKSIKNIFDPCGIMNPGKIFN